ncbi:MAG: prepilin-type N-terminal cleavage/methylation domain-containing protein [Candidatus Binatia bacterium]
MSTTGDEHRRAPPLHGREDAGFTLLEVMVALAVVAFAFVGLLGLQGRNIKAVARDQSLTRATLLARELVSQIQYQVSSAGLEDLGDSQGTFDGYPGYRWERQVIATDLDEVREVVVRVIWDERNPHACELVYFVRDPAV